MAIFSEPNRISSENTRFNVITNSIYCFVGFIVLLFFIYGQFYLKHPHLFDFYCEEYLNEWTYTREDGSVHTVVAPETLDVYAGEVVYLDTILPDNLRDDCAIYMRTGHSFVAIIDGEERYRFDSNDTGLPGVSVKSIWIPINLTSADSGKTLTIIRYNTSVYNGYLNEVYLANTMGFLNEIVADNTFLLIVSFVLLALCSIIALFCLFYRIVKKTHLSIIHLCVGVILCCLWQVFDNYMYPLIFGNYFIDGKMEYMLAILLPVPFAIYLNQTQKRRYQMLTNILTLILIVAFVVFTLLDFSGIHNFNITTPYMNTVTGLVICGLFAVSIYDIFYRKNHDYILIAIGFLILLIFAIAEIIHINMENHFYDGIFLALGLLILLVLTSIHEIKRILILQKESMDATQSNKAKSAFLANMSHEIRTPINAIMGLNSLILREPISPTVKEYSESIRSSSRTLLEIVGDILDFSKIEQGRMELVEQEYEVADLLSGVITMCKVKADEKGLNFKPEIGINMPKKLIGDSKHLKEIMINLLNNAVKYTANGSVIFHVFSRTDSDGVHNLCIKIKDTGIGIKDEDRDKVFGNFERLDITKNRNIEGSGLGLAICYGLVNLMNGTITFDSVYGHGTTFTVIIPQKIADNEPIGNLEAYTRQLAMSSRMERPVFTSPLSHILIVDDNQLNLKVISGLLSRTKMDITTCNSGAEMLTLITKRHYDIILLDHMMPEMDGIEALEKAKSISHNLNTKTPFIALTANAISGAKEMYIKHGFTDYLSKPVEDTILEDMLIKHLPQDRVILTNSSDRDYADGTAKNGEGASVKHFVNLEAYTPDINTATGMKYCSGMEDFYRDTLTVFQNISAERKDSMEKDLLEENYKNYQITIHAVKSNALTIGAEHLSEEAKALEYACKEGRFDYVIDNHKKVMELYQLVLDQVAELLNV